MRSVVKSSPARRKAVRRWLPAAAAVLMALAGCGEEPTPVSQRVVGGNPERGRAIIAAIECGVCHAIPGVAGAHGVVGPALDRFANRQLIGGVAPNHPGILTTWVRNAPSVSPDTGMPDLPLTVEQARDVAAYLYTLR